MSCSIQGGCPLGAHRSISLPPLKSSEEGVDGLGAVHSGALRRVVLHGLPHRQAEALGGYLLGGDQGQGRGRPGLELWGPELPPHQALPIKVLEEGVAPDSPRPVLGGAEPLGVRGMQELPYEI